MLLKRGLLIIILLLVPIFVSSQAGFPGGFIIPDISLGTFSMVFPAVVLVDETGSGTNDNCDARSGVAAMGISISDAVYYGPNGDCGCGEELPKSLPSGDRCLVFAVEEDSYVDDCAYAKVGEFSIIGSTAQTISDLSGYSSCYDASLDGCESDATCLLGGNYGWTGSYLCHNSYWYTCIPDTEGTQAIKEGDNFFVCDETVGNWVDKTGEDYCSQINGVCGDSCPDGVYEYSQGNYECSVLGLGSTCCASPQNQNVCEENNFLWHPDEGETSGGNACCGDSEEDFGNFFNGLVCIEQADGTLAWIEQSDSCPLFGGYWNGLMSVVGMENSIGPYDGCCGDDDGNSFYVSEFEGFQLDSGCVGGTSCFASQSIDATWSLSVSTTLPDAFFNPNSVICTRNSSVDSYTRILSLDSNSEFCMQYLSGSLSLPGCDSSFPICVQKTTADYSWFDSTSLYLCLNDYNLAEDEIGGSDWYWWDASGAGNSYKIHTIAIN